MKNSSVKWVRLGDYIEQCDERNTDLRYDISDVMGMTITKEIISTKANLAGNDLSKFKIVDPREFVFNPRTHGKRIGLGLNNTNKAFLISWNNIAFRIAHKDKLLPNYLYLYFNRDEWDRYACFNSWGSSTEVFTWNELCRMEIPLPSVAEQQKVVNAWRAFREIKEQNEAKAAPLMQLCQSYIQELKHKYPMREIGAYIEECNLRNDEAKYNALQLKGVTSDGVFDVTKAKVQDLDFSNYKVVKKNDFAYNPSRINIGSIALSTADVCIISPMYIVFHVSEDIIIPEYLALWFRRTEFQRSTLFFASGSVRDTFGYKEMCNVKIPLPPIEVQQAIVNIYKCANEAKQIAEEADWLSHEVCPALLQHVIHS